VASGLVTQAKLDGALKRQHSDGGRLGEVLVNEGLVTEQDIVRAVAGQMRIGVVDLSQTAPQANAISLLQKRCTIDGDPFRVAEVAVGNVAITFTLASAGDAR
jgi:hypothetical protein